MSIESRRELELTRAKLKLLADQIRFLRSVQEVFLKNKKLVEADLYEPPSRVFGRNAVERFFTPQEIRELLELARMLAA